MGDPVDGEETRGHSSATPLPPALQSVLCKDGCLEKQMLMLLTGLWCGHPMQP